MNEIIFICHVALAAAFALMGCRLGKAGLIGLIALQGVLANLFVVKQISLFGFVVTCSDVFAVGGILSLNLLQEYFGKGAAKEAVRVSLLTLVFFAGMAQVHLLYAPASCDGTQDAFQTIFSSSPRIILASIATFYLVQKFDVFFFSWLRGSLQSIRSSDSKAIFDEILLDDEGTYEAMSERLRKGPKDGGLRVLVQPLKGRLAVRVAISLLCSQFLDTVLFSFLGLYGLVASLTAVILLSFLVKCLVIAASSPFIALSKRWVRDVSI